MLAQRGRFALHAGTAVVANTTIAVAGASGAGKSTTTLALATAGLDRVRGAEAVEAVHRHLFRRPLLGRPWHDELTAWVLDLAPRVAVHRLTRPGQVWSALEIVEVVEELADSG